MHIANDILKEVAEDKIVDIFSEPGKTKVFLQLKELELIDVSEKEVRITNEGKKALVAGIMPYFKQKRIEQAELMKAYAVQEENPAQVPESSSINFLILFPLAVFLMLILALACAGN